MALPQLMFMKTVTMRKLWTRCQFFLEKSTKRLNFFCCTYIAFKFASMNNIDEIIYHEFVFETFSVNFIMYSIILPHTLIWTKKCFSRRPLPFDALHNIQSLHSRMTRSFAPRCSFLKWFRVAVFILSPSIKFNISTHDCFNAKCYNARTITECKYTGFLYIYI